MQSFLEESQAHERPTQATLSIRILAATTNLTILAVAAIQTNKASYEDKLIWIGAGTAFLLLNCLALYSLSKRKIRARGLVLGIFIINILRLGINLDEFALSFFLTLPTLYAFYLLHTNPSNGWFKSFK